MSLKIINFKIPADLSGLRLDKALSSLEEVGSRSRAQDLIEKNKVKFKEQHPKPSQMVNEGEVFVIEFPEPQPSTLVPLDIPLNILYEDEDLLVVNKPAGLVVHPAVGHENDTLVNALIHHTPNLSMKFGEDRPGIVHRLDKDTSGTLVVAKNDATHEALSLQFQERKMNRIYWALCHTLGAKPQMKIQSFIARHPTERKKMASVKDRHGRTLTDPKAEPGVGKWAVTHVTKVQEKNGLTLFKLKLETGRTHQIRVHLSELGFPIVGDIMYGSHRKLRGITSPQIRSEVEALERFYLHASELGFTHPRTGETLSFSTPWPEAEARQLKDWGFMLNLLEPAPPAADGKDDSSEAGD